MYYVKLLESLILLSWCCSGRFDGNGSVWSPSAAVCSNSSVSQSFKEVYSSLEDGLITGLQELLWLTMSYNT